MQQSTAVISAGSEIAAHLAWEQVFDYFLDRERERFSSDEFVACLISGIAVATGTNTARLVRELTAAAPKLDVASERRSGLPAMLTDLTGDNARVGNEALVEAFERLKQVLVNMLEFGSTSGFDTAWGDLLLYYPDLTSAVIREHGKKSVVRKRIAVSFSDSQIREVIRLIEPENSEFIEAFAHQSALIADDKRVRPPDRSVHKKQIREFVLTYLLVDRGSRFNEKAFTGSVIQQLAAHYWTYRQLLTSLREGIEITQPPGPMKARILGIVTELEGELAIETQLRKKPAPESRRQIRGADLYTFLELHLLREAVHETIPGDPLSTLAGLTVRELQRDHPEMLLKLFKVLQSRPDAVRRAADRLSAERLEQLATAFLVLVSSPEKEPQRELQAAIARWADRAADRRRYFAAVLDAVVRGELIDFERIVAGRQKRAVTEPTTGSVAEPLQIASYLTWFLTVAPLDPREKTLYLSLLEGLIANSPQAVCRYLINMIKELSLCPAFMQLTPWRLIQKAMAAMAGFADGMRYVAILEGVFRPETLAACCGPADFVKIVIDVLAEQQHADGEGFLKTAFGRLVVRIGDAAARERAVDALEKIVSTKGAALCSIAAYYRDTTNLVPTGDKVSADTHTPEESAVLAYLKGDDPAAPPSLPALKRALETMILHTPEKLYWFIAEHLDHGSITEKLIALLSEPFRARLLHILLPRHFCLVQQYVDLLHNAAYGPGRFDSQDEVNQCIWQGAFSYLRETGLRVFDEEALVRRMVEFLAENRKNTDRAAFYANLGRQLTADIQPSTRADHQILIRIVSEVAQQLRPSESVPPSFQAPPAATTSVLNDDEETPWDEEIYLANAGMVIAAPYLPRLFDLLGLTEQSRFTSREAAERGVHLLQYMVDERTSTPEYRLVLNKILCGVKPGIPIVREIEITDKETEAITSMMTAMIQNWKIIGNTSISGFRESFFQRKARLTRKEGAWHLQVEEQAFDMLLDQIPWSFSTIKYSWMDRVIFVKWR
ncbi:MAG: contractile injection system tape measure protein [Pseudomonadota bacterium]|nr:contractile injection system tape measure protein [Pseudomonadota bacterium]